MFYLSAAAMLRRPDPCASLERPFCRGTRSAEVASFLLISAGVSLGWRASKSAAAAATWGAAIEVPGHESYSTESANSEGYNGVVDRMRSPGATSVMCLPV